VRAVVVVMVRAESPLVRPLLLCNWVWRASIAGKITAWADADATRAFWWWWLGGGEDY
jgi:hypothetical protein